MTTSPVYTTKELTEYLCLTKSNVILRSRREGWKSQPRSGRGGGSLWLLESMPEATRLAIAKALISEQAREAEAERRKQPVNTLQSLPPSGRDRAEARALAVQLARRFYANAGLPKTSVFELFAQQYNSGQAVVADWVKAALPRLSRASLFNWEKALVSEGLEALSGSKYGKHRKGTGAMDQPYVFAFILAHIYKFPHAGATQIYNGLKDRLFLQQRPERMATCLRKAITMWGVPEIVRTDNGQDYVSRHIERVLLDMDIYHDVCNPFSPQEKPFVERVFKTFLHDNFELLTGYVGHNVSERKAIEARKSFAQRMLQKDETVELNLSPEELQKFCDMWSENTYAHREHSRLGTSPYAMAREYDGTVSRVASEEALRLLFLPCPDKEGTRTVSKNGIRIFNDNYIAPELGLHTDKTVQIRIDDADHGRIYVYSLDGSEFICIARGMKHDGMRAEEIKAVSLGAQKRQREHISEERSRMVAAAKEANVDEIAFERLQAAALRAERIIAEQPVRAEVFDTHSTPALEGAARAAEKPDYTPVPMTEAQSRMQAVAAETFKKALKDGLSTATAEKPEERFVKAQRFEEIKHKGGVLPVDDKRWLANYQQTAEYDTQKRIYEMFGDIRLRAAKAL